MHYIKSTVDAINSETEWQPADVEKESFFCNTLCNHRDNCPHIREYNKQFHEGKEDDNIMNLF